MRDCKIMADIRCVCIVAGLLCLLSPALTRGADFVEAKTIFQTNTSYDERLAIAVDGVIVHRHGGEFTQAIQSWRDNGFTVGRMFFADSDAANAYWTGKWDGTEHREDVERDQDGKVVKCSGVRPYMLPTEGWIRYLEEMTDASLAAGAAAILPEEPLAHVFTGYEKAFAELWLDRYGQPWEPQHTSARARFLTAQLKNELYIKLEERLLKRTRQFEKASGKNIAFVLPIHSLYSNIAAQLVAPLGTSAKLDDIDGYIGQIWTGPVNWALGCYDSPRKDFFTSAYVLYDYFTQLAVETDKKLWLLVDPVEDNPSHKWSEFAQWYKHCIAAMLLMDEVDSYEIMPWPDRIFLPGYGTGGGTPAPEDYRITILAVTQALQEIPTGGKWLPHSASGPAGDSSVSGGIGVAIADTLMWQRLEHPRLQGVYSLLLPLVERGIPVSSFLLERLNDQAYLSRFSVIVLSYESFKPLDASMNSGLTEWIKAGGSLIILGGDGDELDQTSGFWWRDLGLESPMSHLLAQLKSEGEAGWRFGNGWVARNDISPSAFADPCEAESTYLPLLDSALKKANRGPLKTPGVFLMQRGEFVIAHAGDGNIDIPGKLIDIFDPDLALCENVRLIPGQSGLYRDVAEIMERGEPALLHTTHRLISQEYKNGILRFTIRGPRKTPAVARLFLPKGESAKIAATDADGKSVETGIQKNASTIRLKFPNNPKGVTVKIE
ncbi:MAG: hypothetical protein JXN61_17075 [Sedimentisphaerales bacterium]|nr:hypothetical protein [Sedimentisphaerales bacterium]